MSHHLVLIPVHSDMAVELHTSDLPINVADLLRERSEGIHVAMNMTIDDEENGTLHFLVNEHADRNYRAERAVRFMTGVSIQLTGNVAMYDTRPDLTDALMHEI